jgi:adenylate cyclase
MTAVHHLRQVLRDGLDRLRQHTSYAFWAPVVALGLAFLWNQTDFAQRLEYLSEDLRFEARAPFDPPADPRLIFVGIDQATLDQLGAWPWPRNIEAKFLDDIARSGMNPNVVAFDILLTEDFDKFNFLQLKTGDSVDQLLGDSAGQLPCVITGAFSLPADAGEEAEKRTGMELSQPSLTAPLTNIQGKIENISGSNIAVFPVRPLRAQSFFGFVNDNPSRIDGIRHSLPFLIRVGNRVYPSLTLQVLCQMLDVDPDKVEIVLGKFVRLTNSSKKTWTIPINDKGEVVVNYRNNETFAKIPFHVLLNVLDHHITRGDPIPPQAQIDKKTVFIAGSAIGLADLGTTPLDVNVPLGYTHLNVINNVLRDDYISFVPRQWVMIGWLLVTWATLFNLRNVPTLRAVAVPLLIMIVYAAAAFAIFWRWSTNIDLVWPLLALSGVNFGAVVLRWLEELRGREQVKKTFAQMLSPDLVNHLLNDPSSLNLGGSKRSVTILFSDIRSYTTLSEATESQELVRQLNRYFDRMVRCILNYRGTLHGFTGDGIMAVWGDVALASSGAEKDAANAVHSALQMRRKLVELNQERALENLPPFRIGIGLNHGDVVVGQLGAASISIRFSVIGDTVNTASRIEGVTKEFGIDLAIGENLRDLLGDEFIVRRLGRIQLKGKKNAILAYEVLTDIAHSEESTWKPEELTQYETAFDHYLARRFKEAIASFMLCTTHHPNDFGVNYYLESSWELVRQSPPENWDGRVVMKTK